MSQPRSPGKIIGMKTSWMPMLGRLSDTVCACFLRALEILRIWVRNGGIENIALETLEKKQFYWAWQLQDSSCISVEGGFATVSRLCPVLRKLLCSRGLQLSIYLAVYRSICGSKITGWRSNDKMITMIYNGYTVFQDVVTYAVTSS